MSATRSLIQAVLSIVVAGSAMAQGEAKQQLAESPSDQRVVQETIASLPRYEPKAVPFPADASYVTPDGSIAVFGYDDMVDIFAAVNKKFAESHPQFKFSMILRGTYTAPPALGSGASAFAPMGAEFDDIDVAAYRKLRRSLPLMIKVAHDAVQQPPASAPIGIFVHKSNPIAQLTTADVARLFTSGSAKGDVKTWGELGLTGEWAGRPVHSFGIPLEGALGAFMQKKFDGRPFSGSHAFVKESSEVIDAVRTDPGAIGFAAINLVTPEIRAVAIRDDGAAAASSASVKDVIGGAYAYDRHLLIYLRQPVEPWVREYLRLVLSREGQELIAGDRRGYLPLRAQEVAEELAKLNR